MNFQLNILYCSTYLKVKGRKRTHRYHVHTINQRRGAHGCFNIINIFFIWKYPFARTKAVCETGTIEFSLKTRIFHLEWNKQNKLSILRFACKGNTGSDFENRCDSFGNHKKYYHFTRVVCQNKDKNVEDTILSLNIFKKIRTC